MIKKTSVFILLMALIFILSCGTTSRIEFSEIKSGSLSIVPLKHTLKTNVAIPGGDWIDLIISLNNNSSSVIKIDFDDMFLMDNENNKLRVEYVSRVKLNTLDKLYLNLQPNSEIKKKVTFFIKEKNHVKSIIYEDKKVNLNFIHN